MSELYGPFNAGTGSNFDETQWRELFANLFTSGVINGAVVAGAPGGNLAVSSPGGSMNISIATGCALIEGFAYENTAAITKTITGSDPSLNRIDVVTIVFNFVARTVLSAVHVGVLAASPVAPALTQNSTTWEIPLCWVTVGHGVSTLNSGNLQDQRAYCGTIPPPALQGPGSGLNADLIDGLSSAVFALGNAPNMKVWVFNRAVTNADGNNGDLVISW